MDYVLIWCRRYRTQEGGELIRKAVALAEEINGPDHPYTLR